ncbi:hypothetical protein JWJ90_11125 [Desulfobulbus rhabdoformis]|jgi:hypothetical protein|uniref:hypothetical protein n=1 Tax=Desulfobulbus rhabdoformis TaxID=34032 RepID=UPI001962EB9B|nr:hypothetical protein [Desulfobulbus rhabdoformis]MBM9614836.1 hypothetical protein [Desulfobulbus rhabdoformis]
MKLDPNQFGLNARTRLEQHDPSTIALIMDRKSRIIMADGRKILEKIKKIREVKSGIAVVVKTTAPVCSKTLQFLAEERVDILPLKS